MEKAVNSELHDSIKISFFHLFIESKNTYSRLFDSHRSNSLFQYFTKITLHISNEEKRK
jgi:hypothetical protein